MIYDHGLFLRVGKYGVSMLAHHHGKGSTGRVRGHRAGMLGLGPGTKHLFGRGYSCDSIPGTGPAAEAAYYPDGAVVSWPENGLFVELQGPYEVAKLEELAEGIRFDPV